MLELAKRFFGALERGDMEAVRACYTPDALIWHNFDEREQSVDENLVTLGWLAERLSDKQYDVVRCEVLPTGFLQQHVLRGTLNDGTAFAMPACIICTVNDGRIVRLDEYLDTAQAARLRKPRQ